MSSLTRSLLPILRDALFVVLLTLLALAFAYQVRSRIVIDVGSAHDDFFLRRFFDAERYETETYRWTRDTSRVELEGQQLAAPWNLQMRVNGYRPNRSAQVKLRVNGTPLDAMELVGNWDLYEASVNANGDLWSGTTTLEISSDTFVPQKFDPKNGDTRRLGIAVDSIAFAPARSTMTIGNQDWWIDFEQTPVVPPFAVLLSWASALGFLYASARGIGLSTRGVNVFFTLLILGVALGIAIARPYVATFTNAFFILALTLSGLTLLYLYLVPRLAAHFGISMDARARAILGAIVLLCVGLKWGGVWYPQFHSSDLAFHGHRLEYVASGNLFFTSELPDAARRVVPYPPALYIFLAPFAPWLNDPEGLLLVGNVLLDALVIVAFYFTARRAFEASTFNPSEANQPAHAALFSTFLFAFNPVSFWIYSWGNHTNIFGQAAANLLFFLLLTQSLARPRHFLLALFFLFLASAAHLGVFLSLLAFFPLAILLRWFTRDTNTRREAFALALVFLSGIAIVFVLYYAEFSTALFAQTQTYLQDFMAGRAATRSGVTFQRVADVARFTTEQLGWILLVAGIVEIPFARKNFSGRVRALWLAWLLVGVLFGLVTIGSTFSTRYTLWAAPALALSGGLMLARLSEKSRVAQLAAYALGAFALAQTLWLWIDRVLNAYQ